MEQLLPRDNSPHHAVQEVIEELWAQIEKPLGNDQAVAIFAGVMADEISNRPDVQARFAEAIDYKRERGSFTASYGANFLLRLCHFEVMRKGQSMAEFPIYEESAWRNLITSIYDNPDRTHDFFTSMEWWDIGSNVYQRARAVKAAAGLLRLPNPFSYLEVGASRLHIMKAIEGDFPLGEVEVLQPDDSSQEYVPASAVLREYINNLVERRIQLNHSIGVDPWQLRDSGVTLWKTACSSYPGEFAKASLVKMHELLEVYKSDKLHFICAFFPREDITELTAEPPLPPDFDFEFDLAGAPVMMYQLLDADRRSVFDAMSEMARYSFVMDFVETRPYQPGMHPLDQLTFVEHWMDKNFLLRMMVYDRERPQEGLREMFVMDGGRVNKIVLGELAMELVKNPPNSKCD